MHIKWSGVVRIGIAAALAAAIVASLIYLPTPQYLKSLLEWIQGQGNLGLLLLVVLYAVICLLLLPGSALTLAAGFMFGMVWGTIAASLGATLGATAAFLIARLMVRGWIEHRLTSHPKFRAVDRAIGDQGFKIVLLVRLCSLFPYDLTSYLFGLTNVPLGRYVLATWLGRLPEILAWAYVGSMAKNLADLAAGNVEMGIEKELLLGLGLAAMVTAAVVIGHVARKALREAVDAPEPQANHAGQNGPPFPRTPASTE
jgi:uncharacterized membrane protein YdjX (TVP38/TMEM64 family)